VGAELLAGLLLNWLAAARRRVRREGERLVRLPASALVPAAAGMRRPPLPAPLWARAAAAARSSHCFAFDRRGTEGEHEGQLGQRDTTLRWRSVGGADGERCPRVYMLPGPRAPAGWVYCLSTLAPTGATPKISPGLVALAPGAELSLLLHLPRAEAAPSGTSASVSANISLTYLASYTGMGRVVLSCVAPCACAVHTIDAHRPAVRASTYEADSFIARAEPDGTGGGGAGRATGATIPCELRLRVAPESRSGGFMFRLRGGHFFSMLPSAKAAAAAAVEEDRSSVGAHGRSGHLETRDGVLTAELRENNLPK
jgi:hypothetical protein